MTFGEYIIELREARNYSQRELARRAGITNSTVSRLEKNQVTPDLITIDKLSKATFVPRQEMINRFFEHYDCAS